MDINTLRGIETAILLVLFIGLVFWVYSKKRKSTFDEAARMPLEENDDGIFYADDKLQNEQQGEKQ
jgi:cytochrome c oxidase cbb3-type subunit 4